MGLSIHYNGSFNDDASFPEMINEVKDIAKVCNWEYFIFDEEFPLYNGNEDDYDENIYGICFAPPECEPVFITFLSNRRMSSPHGFELFKDSKDPERKQYMYYISVKTQYAGIEIHKFVIHIFKHLQRKEYFKTLNIKDEGEYWETGDENRLKQNFTKYSDLIDSFGLALESIPKSKEEKFEDYFERIMRVIKKRKK